MITSHIITSHIQPHPARTSLQPPNQHPKPHRLARNHFQALFEQIPLDESAAPAPNLPAPRPAAAPKAAEVHLNDVTPPASPPVTPSLSTPQVPGLDLSEYSPMRAPVSLDPLVQAIQKAGLDVNSFRFDELEAPEPFPGRPDLSYTNRQILIRGPKGAQLFDLNLALRTPWVTAAELRFYGLV